MLAVVEHEQELARSEVSGDRVHQGATRERAQIERLRDGVGNVGALADRIELDEDRAVGMHVLAVARELEREPCLARATRAGEREQAGTPEQRPQLSELVLASDERARLERQPSSAWHDAEDAEDLLQLLVDRCQPPAFELGPVVVAVLGQQLAAVEGERALARRGSPVAPRVGGRDLERLDIEVCIEPEQPVLQLDRLGAQRLPRRVHRLVEVVRRRARVAIRPKHVHRLLAMEPMPVGERQQLHQLPRLTEPPGRVRDRRAGGLGRKTAQQGHARPRLPRHRRSMTRGQREYNPPCPASA